MRELFHARPLSFPRSTSPVSHKGRATMAPRLLARPHRHTRSSWARSYHEQLRPVRERRVHSCGPAMLQGLAATTQILGTIKHERVRWPPSARPPRPHSRPPALSLAVQRWHRADAHTCTSAQPDVAARPILTATTLARAQAYDSGRGARRRRKAEDASSTVAPARSAPRR